MLWWEEGSTMWVRRIYDIEVGNKVACYARTEQRVYALGQTGERMKQCDMAMDTMAEAGMDSELFGGGQRFTMTPGRLSPLQV